MFANPGVHAADEAVVNSYRGLLSHGNGYKLVRTIEDISAKVSSSEIG
jgi:hypothetical protein